MKKNSPKINMKRYFQVIGICLAVMLIGLLGTLGFGFWNSSTSDIDAGTVAISDDGKINVLLMGVDEGGLRTDCIMVVSFDTQTKQANLLSIPRDTRMYVGKKYQKINAAHAITNGGKTIAGPQGTVEAVTRLTGIPINYYVEMSFDDVAEVINTLGPIEFEIPDLYNDGVGMVYDDPVQSLHINLKPGLQQLDGSKAVQLLRYRKGNMVNGVRKSYPNGDRGRVEMQQKFIQAVIDQKLNASLILKIPAIFKQLSDTIKTNFTVSDIMKYSKYLNDFSTQNLQSYSLPGTDATIDGASYWVCDLDATRELIQNTFGYDASRITIDKEYKATATPATKTTGVATTPPTATAQASKSTSTQSSTTTKSSGTASKSTTKQSTTESSTSSKSTSKATAKPAATAKASSSTSEKTSKSTSSKSETSSSTSESKSSTTKKDTTKTNSSTSSKSAESVPVKDDD